MRAGFEPAIHDTVRVGSSAQPKPGRLLRGGFSSLARSLGFCPLDGGGDDLSGVLGGFSGRVSRASNSAIRASAASNGPTSGSRERISASFSATVSLARSISGASLMSSRP